MSAKSEETALKKKNSKEAPFQFKQFSIQQDKCTMKVGTDGVLLGAWVAVENAQRILDIGTGTGLIAIMLGQRQPEAHIDGVEIDDLAFAQAQDNMRNAPWSNRLQAIHRSIQDYVEDTPAGYDLIVSNPPFFSGGTFSFNQDRNSVRHTVKLPHGDMLRAVQKLLNKPGKFCVILPFVEGLRFQELAASFHFYCTRTTEVLPKANKPVERLLMQFELENRRPQRDRLIIQGEEMNEWTEAYQSLTREFYLKM
jgi:tRNA1Val (adenine37-N6)-methyltransferase